MAVETVFSLAAAFPAGGDFDDARAQFYDRMQSALGLTYLQAITLVQFYVRGASLVGGVVPPASPGDLIVITALGIPMLTAPQQVEVSATTGVPLPPKVNIRDINRATWHPAGTIGKLRVFMVGGQARMCYWDGTDWRRVSNDVSVATPPFLPGQFGAAPVIP